MFSLIYKTKFLVFDEDEWSLWEEKNKTMDFLKICLWNKGEYNCILLKNDQNDP